MTTITTSDGFVYWQNADGTYSDGDEILTASEITSNGRDN